MKLFQNVYLYESRGSLRLGQVGLSTRSLGQILEKSCVHSKGHNFDLIFMNSQNINLHDHVQNWVILGKNYRSLGQTTDYHIVHIRSIFFSHPSLLPYGQGFRVLKFHIKVIC